ncbi:MAG: site-2 protease family protein [Patescibacteria group bacterium]
MILTIVVFLLVIGVLILVHEFGHFIMAKKVGVKVEEFAIGFPPRLFSKKKGETEYSINAIPLGGYVKMLGELEHSKDKRAFENQTPGKRFSIAVAGVVMNLILAWVILTIGFAAGMSPIVSSPDAIPGKKLSSEIIFADVSPNSSAEKAGILSGDVAISATSSGELVEFSSLDQFDKYNSDHKNQVVKYQIKRDGNTIEKEAALSDDSDSQLGVAIIEKAVIRVPWYKAPYVALHETYEIVKLTFEFFGSFVSKLFSTGTVEEGVGGPVAIYVYTGMAVKAGAMVLLQFVALLSINLAVINILPFPALDGGRLVFILLEKIFKKRVVKEKVENTIHLVGYALLILLIVAITYRDIANLFHK